MYIYGKPADLASHIPGIHSVVFTGNSAHPVYEIGSPLFKKIVIDLGNHYGRGKTFTIIAENASHDNMYVQKAVLNGRELKSFKFPAKELLAGGTLKLIMGVQPNTS